MTIPAPLAPTTPPCRLCHVTHRVDDATCIIAESRAAEKVHRPVAKPAIEIERFRLQPVYSLSVSV